MFYELLSQLSLTGGERNPTWPTIAGIIIATVLQTLWLNHKNRVEATKLKQALKVKEDKDRKARIRAAKRAGRFGEIARKSLSINTENRAEIVESKELTSKVYQALNGDGVTGQLKLMADSMTDIVQWQDQYQKDDSAWKEDHENKDVKRHDEVVKQVQDLSAALSVNKPLAALAASPTGSIEVEGELRVKEPSE